MVIELVANKAFEDRGMNKYNVFICFVLTSINIYIKVQVTKDKAS